MRIPLSLFAAGLSWWVLDSRGSGERRDIAVDWVGAVALFSVLASFLVVVNRSAEEGPLSPLVLASAALLAVSIPVLIASQRRSARPILDFGLFRRPGYGLGLGVLVFHYTSLGAILLLAPFFFIDALGFSATKMGLFIMLHTLMRVFLAPVSGALTHRVGAWRLSGLGLAAMVCSLGWLSVLAASGSSEIAILGALLLAGVGSALYEPPNTTTIMGSVPPDRYGDRVGVDSFGAAALVLRPASPRPGPFSPCASGPTWARWRQRRERWRSAFRTRCWPERASPRWECWPASWRSWSRGGAGKRGEGARGFPFANRVSSLGGFGGPGRRARCDAIAVETGVS